MGSRKSAYKKNKLIRKARQNRAIPVFVVAKTNRKTRTNLYRRSWRTDKIKAIEKEE